jgi:hypothetical protein
MLLALAIVIGAGTGLPAHENFRVIGTLERFETATIAVKKTTGATVSIRIDQQTVVQQNNKKVDTSALAVGQSVVVDAYGDSEDDALAIEIRIVPPIRRGRQ